MGETFFNGVWRMDWGLGNPNKTAALIAMLMLAAWWLARVWRWGFWLALALFAGLGACLIHTFSRGGLLALAAGLIPVLRAAQRPWPRGRVMGACLAVWVMIGFAVFLSAHERYGKGVAREDRSIGNRLEIWRRAPAMMVAAPGGWGWGQSGRAYMQWFQEVDAREEYRTLVNSHLTWLVEMGWPLRFLYVACWGWVLLLCLPNRRTGERAVAFGVWLAFGVAAVFSSVAESPWLWVLPTLALGAAVAGRWRSGEWPVGAAWLGPVAAAGAVCGIFFAAGLGAREVRVLGDCVVVGRGTPSVWVVADEQALGQVFGRALRRHLRGMPEAARPVVGVARSPASIPDGVAGVTVVVAGTPPAEARAALARFMDGAGRVVFLSPGFHPLEMGWAAGAPWRGEVVFGEFTRSAFVPAWSDRGRVRRVEGAGDYLAAWPEIILNKGG